MRESGARLRQSPRVASSDTRRRSRNQVVVLLLLLAVPWAFGTPQGSDNAVFGWRVANTLLALLVGHAVFALQLAGQVGGARIVGDRIIWAQLGLGPVLYSRSRAVWTFSLRALPADVASALVTTRERGQRLRTFVSILSGIVAVASPLVVLRLVHPTPYQDLRLALTSRLAPDAIFTFFAFVLIVMHALSLLGLLLGSSDLSGIKPEIYRARLALGHAVEADVALERGAFEEAIAASRRGLERYPEADVLHVTLANALTSNDDPGAFAAVDALRGRVLTPPLRAIANRLYAWQLYLRGDANERLAARDFSEAALAANPNKPEYLATHGCILLWQGELAKAEPLLVRGFTASRARLTRVAAATGIARLCARTNRVALATKWLDRAREQDILHDLVATVAAEIEPLRRV